MYFYLLFLFLIIVLIVLIVVWYFMYCNLYDVSSTAIASNFTPYPYDREQCKEIIHTNKNKNKHNIAIVCLSVGKRNFAEITRDYLERYCKKHNYHLHYFTEKIDDNIVPMWQKILAVDKVLCEFKYDYVMWIDDDILITNFNYKVEDFIGLSNNLSLTLSRDMWPHCYNRYINSGIFILKNDKISHEFMKDIMVHYDRFIDNGDYDQGSINKIFFEKYHPYATVLPQGIMQSIYTLGSNSTGSKEIYHWTKGDFSMHMAGLGPYRDGICGLTVPHIIQ